MVIPLPVDRDGQEDGIACCGGGKKNTKAFPEDAYDHVTSERQKENPSWNQHPDTPLLIFKPCFLNYTEDGP